MNCELYTYYFNFHFSYLHGFYNSNEIKTSLAQKLNLIFKFNLIKRQINILLWPNMGHKGWRKNRKTLKRGCIIALKFYNKFSSNFVSFGIVFIWLLFTNLLQNLFNIKRHHALVLRKIVHGLFCVFQTKLNNTEYFNTDCNIKKKSFLMLKRSWNYLYFNHNILW